MATVKMSTVIHNVPDSEIHRQLTFMLRDECKSQDEFEEMKAKYLAGEVVEFRKQDDDSDQYALTTFQLER